MASLKELQAQVEKFDKSITGLQSKVAKLSAQMSSGHLGTDQVKQLATQVDKLNASIDKASQKKLKIMDEIALRDFQILNKQIDTVQRNLEQLKAENVARGSTLGGRMSDDFKYAEIAIKKTETALRSLESRKFTQFGPSGYRRGNEAPGSLFSAMEADARLEEVIRATERRIEQARTGTHIPGGATAGPAGATPPVVTSGIDLDKISPAEYRNAVRKAIAGLQKAKLSIDSIGQIEQTADGLSKIKIRATKDDGIAGITRDYQFFVDSMGNYGKTLSQLRRSQIINDPANAKLLQAARDSGFTDEQLKRFRGEGAGGYRVAEFQRNEGGIDYSQSFRVNKTGDVSLAPVRRQYQTFTQNVGKDIVDLLKWSIAISAIYGPINALSDAIADLIDNEAKLADVSIALDTAVTSQNEVFDEVYDSAQKAGEGVGLVIDAFGQAYRAAGRIGDANQRYTTSVKLLDDSLVLSKLSTLDQAEAIDVLTAALYQSADAINSDKDAVEALSNGATLLDQWVRVSQIASVDVATLATGVAVLGDSAETAGLNIEQLNALIATIAETSLSSGKEAANIAKALIGTYQTESAVRELNRLGIAVQDASGKNRQFLEVMRDVAALRSQGILGDADFNRLTLALGGGGIRRQKDVSAFIENFGRMQQIVDLQAGSGGEAQEALAKKLDTVQTAATKLDNAFQSLAQSLGNEGGLLDVFSGTLNVMTKFIEVLDSVISKTGKVGPLLLTLASAALLLKASGQTGAQVIGNNVSPFIAGLLPSTGTVRGDIRRQQGITNTLTGQNALGRIGGSALAIGIPAAQNFASGDSAEGWANVAGGTLGALLGGPVGALAGSAIAEAFVRTFFTYNTQFSSFFAETLKYGIDQGLGGAGTSQIMTPEELTNAAYAEIGPFGSPTLGKAVSTVPVFLSKLARLGPDVLKGPLGESISEQGEYQNTESFALALLKTNNPELYAQFVARRGAEGQTLPGVATPLTQRQRDLSTPDTINYLKELQQGKQEELRNKLITGEIKPSEYGRQIASLSAFTLTATRYMAALVDETGRLAPEFGTSAEAYENFLLILSSGNEELIAQLDAQIAAIDYYQLQLETWKPGTEVKNLFTGEMFTPENLQEIENLATMFQQAFADTSAYGAQQVMLQNLKLPEVFGSNIAPMGQQDLATLLKETQKYQDIRYQELPPETYEALKESFEDVAFLVEDGGRLVHKTFQGIDQKILGEVYQNLIKEGRISGTGEGVGFQQIGATRPQFEEAVRRSNELIKNELSPRGYTANYEDVLVATTDEQIVKEHADMKIVQYILQQILDTEKKQLEGIYNLPEGSTFWVPWQAAMLGVGDGTSGTEGGMTYRDPTVVGERGSPRRDELTELTKSISKLGGEKKEESKLGSYRKEDQFKDKSMEPVVSVVAAINDLINTLKTFFLQGGESVYKSKGPNQNPVGQRAALLGGDAKQINTRFDIKFTSTTQLVVDGRVLASIVKPYLAADLARTNESGGTVTRSYVI